ncbi:MAG: type II toxin-antitoxin system VapC family toxin [Methylocystis sp.]|nr:type II toxin-antitoxin system VapC family toxin [Methylocystis sp.]MCA3583760.1 type II toxin-antitoxin system VapC family toxin [Methylocystis sp.]MCA3586433.1 type II toxin-antitoxin system VapC family toxin [Methylocystis sp.]MCA3589966.1 type II toxin-antitoxin system VapC family toxin [Methylocystis sp.]
MAVLDTHVLVWFITGDSRLGPKALQAVSAAVASRTAVLSAASVFEVSWLASRKRIVLDTSVDRYIARLGDAGLGIVPIDAANAMLASALPIRQGDPIDRFIAAAAIAGEAVLVTADEALLQAGLACPVLDARL